MHWQTIFSAVALGVLAFIEMTVVRAGDEPAGYGLTADVAFAERLWVALEQEHWVGPSRRVIAAQPGERPHGSMQQIAKGTLEVDGRSSRVLVKANHRGLNLTAMQIRQHPNLYLSGYAVMFRRETGYDPVNRDWFWAAFDRNGSIEMFENKAIAGRVDTGATNGCIGCHRKKGGRDLETLKKE